MNKTIAMAVLCMSLPVFAAEDWKRAFEPHITDGNGYIDHASARKLYGSVYAVYVIRDFLSPQTYEPNTGNNKTFQAVLSRIAFDCAMYKSEMRVIEQRHYAGRSHYGAEVLEPYIIQPVNIKFERMPMYWFFSEL